MLGLNTVACGGAEHHGGDSTGSRDAHLIAARKLRQRVAWTIQPLAWTSKCVFHSFATLSKELAVRAALLVKGKENCQKTALRPITARQPPLQVYKDQVCLLTPGCQNVRADNQDEDDHPVSM